MCTKIYLVTRSTRYNSLPTYEKSIDEVRAFESLAAARRFFYDFKTELVDAGYQSIGTRKQTIDGKVCLQTLSFAKQSVFIHLTIEQIMYFPKTPKL